MQRRAAERIPANITVRFYCNDVDCSGTVTNISERGMFIYTSDMLFPFSSEFTIALPTDTGLCSLDAKVCRITKTADSYDGIAVELRDPPRNYLEFVNKLSDKL